ncbi:LuxR C-terminal-related transcriptional regulator [Krasilnikovia cinnamomea]|uniref:LuxR C-terminal-related transcriptional regulator n=1 Tax=Krasilnikovia cinnamomea TaxID=349313 RepID=UPI00102AD8AC|nr:LuxR C-terminal-related transcriptional regulator [Krasilnikovia cinnamomea]
MSLSCPRAVHRRRHDLASIAGRRTFSRQHIGVAVLESLHRSAPRPLGVLTYSSPLRPTTSRSDELFRSLFERSGVGIAILDSRRRVQRVNADLLAMLDRNAAEVEGFEFTELLRSDSRHRLLNRLDALGAGRDRRFTEHVQVRRPDDSVVEGDLTALPVPGDSTDDAAYMVLLVGTRSRAEVPVAPGKKLLSAVDAKILEGVAAGASTVQLAGQLFLSRQGVEYHVSAMLRRLKAPNRPALISRAYRMGILTIGAWPPRVREEFVH